MMHAALTSCQYGPRISSEESHVCLFYEGREERKKKSLLGHRLELKCSTCRLQEQIRLANWLDHMCGKPRQGRLTSVVCTVPLNHSHAPSTWQMLFDWDNPVIRSSALVQKRKMHVGTCTVLLRKKGFFRSLFHCTEQQPFETNRIGRSLAPPPNVHF